MQPKELANVLVKLLGLSICLSEIPTLVFCVVGLIWPPDRYGSSHPFDFPHGYGTATCLEIAMGVAVIFYSRVIVGLLFKAEGV